MKAIFLCPESSVLSLKDFDEPKITNETDVKIKTTQVGICGTDREEIKGGRAYPPDGQNEMIIGHEMLGKVVEVGSRVTKVKPGDYALFSVRRGCGECIPCDHFRSDMCMTGKYTERGIKKRDGFQCQFIVDDEKYVIPVPDSIKHIAVLCEPMSVVEKAIDEVEKLQMSRLSFVEGKSWIEGKNALVAGLGPVGLLASVILRLKGARVIGLDIVPKDSPRVKILEEIGGLYHNCAMHNPIEYFSEKKNVDLIVEAAGVASLDFDLLEMLGLNGAYALTGVPGKQSPINIDGSKLMKTIVMKNQLIVGSVNASMEHFNKGIEDLNAACKKWPGVIEQIITRKYPFEQYEDALLCDSPDDVKIVVEWS